MSELEQVAQEARDAFARGITAHTETVVKHMELMAAHVQAVAAHQQDIVALRAAIAKLPNYEGLDLAELQALVDRFTASQEADAIRREKFERLEYLVKTPWTLINRYGVKFDDRSDLAISANNKAIGDLYYEYLQQFALNPKGFGRGVHLILPPAEFHFSRPFDSPSHNYATTLPGRTDPLTIHGSGPDSRLCYHGPGYAINFSEVYPLHRFPTVSGVSLKDFTLVSDANGIYLGYCGPGSAFDSVMIAARGSMSLCMYGCDGLNAKNIYVFGASHPNMEPGLTYEQANYLGGSTLVQMCNAASIELTVRGVVQPVPLFMSDCHTRELKLYVEMCKGLPALHNVSCSDPDLWCEAVNGSATSQEAPQISMSRCLWMNPRGNYGQDRGQFVTDAITRATMHKRNGDPIGVKAGDNWLPVPNSGYTQDEVMLVPTGMQNPSEQKLKLGTTFTNFKSNAYLEWYTSWGTKGDNSAPKVGDWVQVTFRVKATKRCQLKLMFLSEMSGETQLFWADPYFKTATIIAEVKKDWPAIRPMLGIGAHEPCELTCTQADVRIVRKDS